MPKMRIPPLLSTLLLCTLSGVLLNACASDKLPIEYRYEVREVRAHDPSLFTQGLLIHDGLFYESGGRYGQSRLVAYAEQANEALREHRLPQQYFAEGLTEESGLLHLLTWKENTLLTFDRETFELLKESHYQGEGWGLTDNGEHLIRSDGSDRLYFHEPDSFTVSHTISVREDGQAVTRLNELEFINGWIWANIWHSNRLIRVDPESGEVTGSVDLGPLVRQEKSSGSVGVLNGIAFDQEREQFWVTGKNWRHLYRLELKPAP